MLIGVLNEHASGATVPFLVADATARSALSFAAGGAVAGTKAAATSIGLAQSYLQGLFWSKVLIAVSCVVALAVGGSVTSVVIHRVAQGKRSAAIEQVRRLDQDALQGSWRLVSSSFGGQATPAGNSRYVFEGDQCTFFDKGVRIIGKTYTLDPSQTPKAMDIVTERGVRMWGIYSVAGDTLMVCMTLSAGQRPSDFTTSPDKDWLLIVLNRN
jgi:uncharacterized protein (TIGR03067 family)